MASSERQLTQEHADEFLKAHPDLDVIEVLIPDINGVLRGKWIKREKFSKLCSGHFKLPKTSLAFDIWGNDINQLVFEHGDPDASCLPARGTLLPVPWAKRPTAQVLTGMYNDDGSPAEEDPQAILASVLNLFDELNLTPVIATELEFYLLDKAEIGLGKRPSPVTSRQCQAGIMGPQAYGIDILDIFQGALHNISTNCKAQGLPVDTLVKEASSSQFEVNLMHVPCGMTAADQTVFLKRAIKSSSIADDLVATFMPKPFSDLSGNGFHVHMSLLDTDGRNIFDDGSGQGHEDLRFVIDGLLRNMADLMAIFSPNINSYRRFQTGSHAPLSPNWGYDNRTTAIRVPPGDPAARRFEHRVAGADANPYLVLAGILAGVHDGLTNRQTPPSPVSGDAYHSEQQNLPANWVAAMKRFERSAFIKKYFGDAFVKYYTALKEQELASLGVEITTMEYDSYLTLV